MDTRLATRQLRIQHWAAIIQDRKASGLKVDDYCQDHGLSRDAYYYWLRKVKEAALVQTGFVELPATTPVAREHDVCLTASVNGITLEIREGVSEELLERAITVIKNAQ